MDDRQRKIEAGAGLQESRLNQDFIDLVKKYGTPVLMVLLVIMASYVGWQRYTQWQQDKTDQAFADLDNAANTPAVLLSVAGQWDGRASVWEIATLRAAKAYLDSARTRTEVGLDPADVEEAELLSDERVRASLEEAVSLFTSVLDRTRGSKLIFAQDARWGLASANLGLAGLTTGEERTRYLDAAQSITTELIEAAEGNDPNRVAVGNRRLELIERLRTQPVFIYEIANLPDEARFQPDPVSALDPFRSVRNPGQQGSAPAGLPAGARPLSQEEIQEMLRSAGMGNNPEQGPPSPDQSIDPRDTPPSDPESADPPASDDPPADDPGQPDR